MDGLIKKGTVFLLFLLLLVGGFPALACEEKPHMLDGPGSVYEPSPLSTSEAKHQLWMAMTCRSQWDLVQSRRGPVQFAVTNLDEDGQVEILAVAPEEGIIYGYEVQAEKGEMEKIPQAKLDGLLMGCPKSPAWFTIPLEHRETWLESNPSHNIYMLLDSYEIFAGRKNGFG